MNPLEERLDGVVEGRCDEDTPLEARLDGVVEGRGDEDTPVEGRFEVPADALLDAPGPLL